MSSRPKRRNPWPVLWLALSAVGFVLAVALASAAFALLASLSVVGALASVDHLPRLRD